MWVRGLKLMVTNLSSRVMHVASYVGAWIETAANKYNLNLSMSHPMWVRGLKQGIVVEAHAMIRRILCGCVD